MITGISEKLHLVQELKTFAASVDEGYNEAASGDDQLLKIDEILNVMGSMLKPTGMNRTSYIEESNDERRFHKLMSDEVEKRLPKKLRGRLPRVLEEGWSLVETGMGTTNSYIIFGFYIVLYYFVTITETDGTINQVE